MAFHKLKMHTKYKSQNRDVLAKVFFRRSPDQQQWKAHYKIKLNHQDLS